MMAQPWVENTSGRCPDAIFTFMMFSYSAPGAEKSTLMLGFCCMNFWAICCKTFAWSPTWLVETVRVIVPPLAADPHALKVPAHRSKPTTKRLHARRTIVVPPVCAEEVLITVRSWMQLICHHCEKSYPTASLPSGF